MQEAQNARVVQDAYAAFGRSDIPAIIGMLDDDIVWQSPAQRPMFRRAASGAASQP